MPSKSSPTSQGTAVLEPGDKKELDEETLKNFLGEHHLTHLKEMSGIAWRAKKLQYALHKNSQLINPKLESK